MDTNDGQKQHESMRSAHARIMDRIYTFADIQSGPNPISADELRKLAEKYPDRWSQFLPKR
jgi:hypothetical protein